MGADSPPSQCSPPGTSGWLPTSSPWDKIRPQWLGLLGKRRRGAKGGSPKAGLGLPAGSTQPGSPPGGWAGGKGRGCRAGGTLDGVGVSAIDRPGRRQRSFQTRQRVPAGDRGQGFPLLFSEEATGLPLSPTARPPARPAGSELKQGQESHRHHAGGGTTLPGT